MGRSSECEACYISERKLPSKWVWLHLQTSAAHRVIHCSPSVVLGSQAALTTLLLHASLTDVPETHSFTVHPPLQSVCQPTSDHWRQRMQLCQRMMLASVLQEMTGYSFLLAPLWRRIQATRHNRTIKQREIKWESPERSLLVLELEWIEAMRKITPRFV